MRDVYLYKKIITIIVGSILLSIGVNFFLVPFKLLDGGMIGLGLIIKYITGMQPGLVIIILSSPIFLLAWVYRRDYFFSSLHGMLFSSFTIDYLSPLHYSFIANFHLPSVISSIIGGIIIGLGIGLMLRYGTSTGGTDLLAQLLSNLVKINVGIIILIMDAFIILMGGIIISPKTLLLSTITILFAGLFTSLCTIKLKGQKNAIY
ncbi:YitT family protein [Gracilibacillus sp. YIM 98692]|uniref:YitT family protein n=1 Tax=Gracilibacillus sp. YIM 98692 TaxID=2663532 RepID=UPI001969E07C|nr:YitT family protein [Gracilibacillus sp. YIM 98692]